MQMPYVVDLLIFPMKSNNQLEFVGSLGPTDCTYTLRPNISRNVLINNDDDATAGRIYSKYIKGNAYKLLVIISHGIHEINNDTTNKYILFIQHGSGATLQSIAIGKFLNKKIISYWRCISR